jgi:predicted transport protein
MTPQKTQLRLTIAIPHDEIDDPNNVARAGTGTEEHASIATVWRVDQVDQAMELIWQGYFWHGGADY